MGLQRHEEASGGDGYGPALDEVMVSLVYTV